MKFKIWLRNKWRYFWDRDALIETLKRNRGLQQQYPKNVAICFIATNKFINYFEHFYESAEKYFLPDTPKQYFVFTDDIEYGLADNITIVKIPHEKHPYINLHKFKYINKAKKQLKKYSHIIFFDADMKFVAPIPEKHFWNFYQPLFCVQHFNFVKKEGSYERREESEAGKALWQTQQSFYHQSCLLGGKSKEFLAMTKELEKRTEKDIKKEIVAKWWDESFVNAYMIEHPELFHSLSPIYAYPIHRPIPKPWKKKIIHDDYINIKSKIRKEFKAERYDAEMQEARENESTLDRAANLKLLRMFQPDSRGYHV